MTAGAFGPEGEAGRRSERRRVPWIGVGVAAMLLGIVWSERGDIADHEIGTILREKGIPAHWRVAAIGLREQVIADVVLGDPAHPDLTIDRIVTGIGLHGLKMVTLVNPRLRGSWRGGKLSFGSLDKLVSGPSTGPFRLPDVTLRVDNGRGQIVGDLGVIGLGLTGSGPLRNGFGGALVAVAHHLDLAGCGAADAKLAGRLTIAAERPRLTGPLTLAQLRCPGIGAQMGMVTLPLDLRARAALDGGEGQVGWSARGLVMGAWRAGQMQGAAQLMLRGNALTARVSAKLGRVVGGALSANSVAGEGFLRSDVALANAAAEGSVSASGLSPGSAAWGQIEAARRAGANTPAGPLLTRIAQVLAQEAPGSRVFARYTFQRQGANTSLALPEARLVGGSGAMLLAVSHGAFANGTRDGLQFSGQFATGGALPLITGKVMRGADHRTRLNLAMAPYQVGAAVAEVPKLEVTAAEGRGTITGEAVLSGPLPDGFAQNLHLPLAGSWQGNRLKLWPGCTPIRFDRLGFASLELLRDRLTLCPQPGGAIVESGPHGIGFAAGMPAFDVAGQLAGTPIHLSGGPLGIAVVPGTPGTLVGKAVSVILGAGQDGMSRFRLDAVNARLGATIGGQFSGSEVQLAAVPLTLRNLGGDWRYAGGQLAITKAAFQLEDREPARLQPLVARDGVLTLAQGVITAQAELREPHSDRAITRVAIGHDLATGKGHAKLAFDGIVFDKRLQPEALSSLLLGVVADVRGTVAGHGTIDWGAGAVTSQGRFITDALDLAAAFGPVKGLSGALTFTDLLGLVSAPDQQLRIAAINPGIEVDNGVLHYALLPGHVLAVEGAEWPFLDGHLRLLPTRLTLGAAEVRRYEMRVDGVDAAKFLVRMNMSNLTATGILDGNLPLVFDQSGGKVVGGRLVSQPPGGSVSYVGALTYKDLSPMANYAFETLKSLNYKQLSIGLDGSLSGDIFTRLSMRGVTQGPGAKRNFVTRQIGKLPLQFNVNIRAPFYMLMTNFKALYDASYLPDPRTLGLMGADGKPVANSKPSATGVQPSVSDTKP